jgi:hypothetical protein
MADLRGKNSYLWMADDASYWPEQSAQENVPMTDEKDKNPVLEVKDGGYPKKGEGLKILGEFFDVNGDNFLGSGMNAVDWSATADFLRYQRCFITQPLYEKRRRMEYIVKLAAEQERLMAQERFATSWSENIIEAIIEGDWKAVKMWAEHLRFEDEPTSFRAQAAARFVKFVEIAMEAYETRPKIFCPRCRKPPPSEMIASWHDGRHVCPWCDVVFDDAGNAEDKARARLQSLDGGK